MQRSAAFLDPQFALQAAGSEMAAQDKLSPVLHRVAMELGQGEFDLQDRAD